MVATGFALITAVLVAAQVPDAAARAKAIAPLVDEQTILVARLDVTRVDVGPIFARLGKLMRDPAEADRPDPQLDRKLTEARKGFEQWLEGFAKAGGRDLYVISPMDIFPAMVLAVPLGGDADAEALSKVLGVPTQAASAPAGRDGQPFRPEVAQRIGGMLVVGTRQAVARVRETTPAERPELAKAFAAAGDGAVQLLILPTDDSRRVMAELLPKLPDALGGGPSSALTDGMRWAAVGVSLKPDLSATGVIQSTDPAAAKALGEVIDRMYADVAKSPPVRKTLPDVGKLLAMLRWQVEGSRLTLSVQTAQADKLLTEMIAPSLQRARQLARRAISGSHLASIGKAMHQYAADNKGAFPPNLGVLVQKKYLSAEALVNPARPASKPGYVYLPPREPGRAAPDTLVAYEAHDQWGEGVNVLCVDGHVEFVRDPTRFETLLKQAGGEPPTTEPARPR
ncbi:MAG TPA: hypothetical protein VM389_07730 [Phycisphaerae bacterium]|nr:hypothetical protein [Phycisphaerae bacterium]